MNQNKDIIIGGDETISVSISIPKDIDPAIKSLIKSNMDSLCGDFYSCRSSFVALRIFAEMNKMVLIKKIEILNKLR